MLNVRQGDIIVGKTTGSRRKILGVVGEAVLASRIGKFSVGNPGIFTNKELTKLGYVTEAEYNRLNRTQVTMEEARSIVADHYDVDVDDVEITS